jgi:hypothetical protein
MGTQKHEIEISADPTYSDSEIGDLAREFESVFQVHTTKYERFGLAEYVPILVIVFGYIAKGFFEGIGKDAWETLKKKLASTVSNRNEISEVEFHYSYKSKVVELKVKSADANVIASGFDQIQSSLEVVERSQRDSIYLEFDPRTSKWNEQMSGGQKVAIHFEEVMATTGIVTVRGRSYRLTEEALKQAAKKAPGMPLKYEHSGPPIGKVEDAWYENGKLMVRGVVFEPSDDKGRAVLDSIKSGKLKGLSLGFSFDSTNH